MVTYAPWYTDLDAIESGGELMPDDSMTRAEYIELYGYDERDDQNMAIEAAIDERVAVLKKQFEHELTHIAGYEDLCFTYCVDCALAQFDARLFEDKDNYTEDDPQPIYSWDSNDSDELVRRCLCGKAIDVLKDVDARRIASEWHSSVGDSVSLLMLSSTGAIVFDNPEYSWLDVRKTIQKDIDWTKGQDADYYGEDKNELMAELEALLEYVNHYGPRGPVDGWSSLNW